MSQRGTQEKGVKSDWATHMIGHELTALHDIDHARTLAIIGPNLYRVLFESKKEKLAQYGERIWKITEGSVDEKANKAINNTTDFLQQMGMPLTVAECSSDYDRTTDIIVERFKNRGWLGLGEKQEVTPEVVRQIVTMSL